jgi:hypothetical protein
MTLEELLAMLANVATLTRDELVTLDADLRAAFAELSLNATADTLADLNRIADAVETVRTESGNRDAEEARVAAELAQLAERVGPVAETPTEPEPDPDPADPDPDEITEAVAEVIAEAETITETAPVLETVTASAAPAVIRRTLAPLGAVPAAPVTRVPATARRATVRVPGYAGDNPGIFDIARAMISADQATSGAAAGLRIQLPVVSVQAAWEAERQLDRSDGDLAKVLAVMGPEALTAAGGICQPVTPYYGSEVLATDARPVRDFLTGFQATRGGVAFNRPYTLSQFSGAITDHTMLADENGATKNCLALTCTSIVEEVVGAIVACVKFGNFQGRFNPESVAAALQLARANWARLAETKLLDAIRQSQNFEVVTIAGGAVADLLYSIGVAAAGYRNRNRMDPGATLDVLLPAWVVNMLQGDLVRQPYGVDGQFATAEATIRNWLAVRGVRVGFYLDSPSTDTSQLFGAQPGGGLLDFPDKVQWGMWAPGSHLFLDGGELNLGIVRDSVLNSTNDYEVFQESFEGHAFIGVESLWVQQDICPSGTQALPKDLSGICGGPYDPGS